MTPELEYYGNHIGGLPFPVVYTRDHAWGITMFVNDDIDLYRETSTGPLPPRGRVAPSTSEPKPSRWPARRPSRLRCATHHGPLIEEDVAMWWAFTQYPENRIHEAFTVSREEGLDRFEANTALSTPPGST